jgi:hypothetical protein
MSQARLHSRQFSQIPRRQRNAVRGIARDIFFEYRNSGGQFPWNEAGQQVDSRVRQAVGSIWVSIAITLAITLIRWWLENRVAEPSAIFEIGEPGNFEGNDGDN